MVEKKFSVSGILRGVEMTDSTTGGKGGNGWKRASLKIEKEDGTDAYASTFDEPDIAIANGANGKNVKITFTKSKDGKYRNIIKGGIKVVGQGEAPVTEEETIEEGEVKEEISEKEGKEMDPDAVEEEKSEPKKPTGMGGYDKTQEFIIRQNSWTQANKYVESCLRAVELGLIDKKEFGKEDLNLKAIAKIAHQIEEDITGKKRLK